MKKYFLQILILATLSCKAQTPILSMDDDNYGSIENAYYKDLDGFLNQFTGTWLYINGSTSLKIVLQKKEMFYKQFGLKNYYSDYIIGEYQYIENGIEKINTLNNLLSNHQSIYAYNINGNIKTPPDSYPLCSECNINEMRLYANFEEPSRRDVSGLKAQIVTRRFVENGVIKLKVWFYMVSPSYGHLNDGTPTSIETYSIPFGEYILIKQ